MPNRLQIELDKILDSCWRCETRNCDECILYTRRIEFEEGIKQYEITIKAKRRERPLTGRARIVQGTK